MVSSMRLHFIGVKLVQSSPSTSIVILASKAWERASSSVRDWNRDAARPKQCARRVRGAHASTTSILLPRGLGGHQRKRLETACTERISTSPVS